MKVNFKIMSKSKQEKGYALLIVLFVMGLLSVIVLGVNVLIVTKLKVTISTANSVIAYYAAESGAEKMLYNDRKMVYDPSLGIIVTNIVEGGIFDNGATYSVERLTDDPVSVKSIGSFQNIKRALELNYSN